MLLDLFILAYPLLEQSKYAFPEGELAVPRTHGSRISSLQEERSL